MDTWPPTCALAAGLGGVTLWLSASPARRGRRGFRGALANAPRNTIRRWRCGGRRLAAEPVAAPLDLDALPAAVSGSGARDGPGRRRPRRHGLGELGAGDLDRPGAGARTARRHQLGGDSRRRRRWRPARAGGQLGYSTATSPRSCRCSGCSRWAVRVVREAAVPSSAAVAMRCRRRWQLPSSRWSRWSWWRCGRRSSSPPACPARPGALVVAMRRWRWSARRRWRPLRRWRPARPGARASGLARDVVQELQELARLELGGDGEAALEVVAAALVANREPRGGGGARSLALVA